VLFRLCLLNQSDLPPLLHQGALDILGISELVGNRQIDFAFVEKILNRSCMPPGEKPIEVSYLRVKLVVFLRADGDDCARNIRKNTLGNSSCLLVRGLLGVFDIEGN
jgi:hypothetical protein